MPEISLTVLFFLFLGGLAAGFVDSIAGGGGLISMPVLLSVGLPPHFALGTNKLQSSFGSLMASINYYRGGLVNLKRLWMGLLFTAIGAAAGSFSVQYVSQKLLQILIPILLIVVFLVVLVFKKLGESDRQPVMAASLFYMIFGLLIGFYDGFFGPGTGNFWVLGFIFLLGMNMKKATGYTKWVNFSSNIVALVFFALAGKVLLLLGLVMAAGQISGAFIGSRLVIRSRVRFIRLFFLGVTAILILRLLYNAIFQ